MNKQNVVWWDGTPNLKKEDGDYFQYSRKTWEYWCKKNDVLFIPFETPIEKDLNKFRTEWQRFIFVFNELERRNIDYNQICLVDSSCMVKWDTPNFFDLTENKFVGWSDHDNLRWVYESIQGYKNVFDDFNLNQDKYISSKFLIFNKKHKLFFDSFKKLYLDNLDSFVDLQDNVVKKGFEQTPLNYWLQINDVDMKLDLPQAFKLSYLHTGGWFSHNWNLNIDKTPFFIKYAYNWVFNGIPINDKTKVMKQTWELVKENYR